VSGATFLTGATGFLGSYAILELLRITDAPVFALVRAPTRERAVERLWTSLQAHVDLPGFWAAMERIVPVCGDLHAPELGLDPADRDRIVSEADAILHIAASLNRKSSKACFNTNLRGTLSVTKLALELVEAGHLRRFTDVSTSAVAGVRERCVVLEDKSIDWDRSDYDPYARTKRFAEHMARELLPSDRVLTLRPSTVMGDSTRDDAWITDMVVATAGLAQMRVVPLSRSTRVDIVPGDWVGKGVATLHAAAALPHDVFHLSAGLGSPTVGSVADALATDGHRLRFAPQVGGGFHWLLRGMDRLPRGEVQRAAAVMKVFWPHITNDVVFDNSRASAALGPPPRWEPIAAGLVRHAIDAGYRNHRVPLPPG